MLIADDEPDLLLAWAVGGAARLIKQRNFTVPSSSKSALDQWLYGSDPVLAWVRARITPRQSDPIAGSVPGYKTGYAHGLFKRWALNAGFRESMIPAVNGFAQRLRSNLDYVVIKHTKGGNFLCGIEIAQSDAVCTDDPIEDFVPGIDLNSGPR